MLFGVCVADDLFQSSLLESSPVQSSPAIVDGPPIPGRILHHNVADQTFLHGYAASLFGTPLFIILDPPLVLYHIKLSIILVYTVVFTLLIISTFI